MLDGVPILVAAIVPAAALGLGALDVLEKSVALWVAVVAGIVQLVSLGVFVGWTVVPRRSRWAYGAASAGIGVAVVVLKLALSH